MKSLQITGDSSYGGAGYLLLRWCRYLLSRDWQVDILATDHYWVSELEKIPGLNVINDIYIPRNIAPIRDVYALGQLLRLMNRKRYDVVHTYTATPGFLGRIAARIAGVPIILHHQAGTTVTEFSSRLERILYTPLEYLAAMASTKNICVSYAVEQQGLQLHLAPPQKQAVIRNGIDAQPFIDATLNGSRDEFRRKIDYSDGHLLIGNTGRLAAQKDNRTLIRAMEHLKLLIDDIPFTLLLAGDGPDRQELEKLIPSLNLHEQVRLIGFISDIPSFLAAIDIFASPSLWEGLSISLLEAMAAAKPIVTTSIPPNAELIDHEKTGLLIPPRSPEQIAQAIARFVNDPELADSCGNNARNLVEESFTIERMFQETLDLYIES